MKKTLLCLLIALLILSPFAAQARELTDDCGRTMTVADDITRVAASGPLAQAILFALAPEKLVGLSTPWSEESLPYIGTAYHDLPILGQLYGGKGEINLETLLVANPQVLIDIGEAKKDLAADMDALQAQTAVPCVHIDAAMGSYPQAFRTLGELLGCAERGEALATFCEGIASQTASVLEKVGDTRARAVYCLGDTGLNVIAKTSYHAEVFDLLTDNAAVLEDISSKGTGNAIDMEQLLRWDPAFIVFAPGDLYETVAKDETWSSLTAIKTGHFIETPAYPMNWMGFPPSVQRYLAMIWLPAALYPDAVEYDMFAEVQQFYDLFFHVQLTRAQYDELTANAFVA